LIHTMANRGAAVSSIPSLRWPLGRVLFALAETVTLLSAAWAGVVSAWFLLLTAFVEVLERLPRGGFLGWRS
jgi:hypothetical protein